MSEKCAIKDCRDEAEWFVQPEHPDMPQVEVCGKHIEYVCNWDGVPNVVTALVVVNDE